MMSDPKDVYSLQHLGHCYIGGSDGKEPGCIAGDRGSVPGLGRSPGKGNGYPLQYSCLENLLNRGAWQATVNGCKQAGMTE